MRRSARMSHKGKPKSYRGMAIASFHGQPPSWNRLVGQLRPPLHPISRLWLDRHGGGSLARVRVNACQETGKNHCPIRNRVPLDFRAVSLACIER